MKAIYLTALALFAVFAVPALADQPNRTKMGWKEYAEASGCIFVDKGGYSNLALASDPSDPCPAGVIKSFWGVGSRLVDPDGTPGTGDEFSVSDN
jgi:hypothetical protein